MHVSEDLLRSRLNLDDALTPIQISTGNIAQWLERLTADQQVPASNPGVPSHCGALARGIWVLQAAHRELWIKCENCRARRG